QLRITDVGDIRRANVTAREHNADITAIDLAYRILLKKFPDQSNYVADNLGMPHPRWAHENLAIHELILVAVLGCVQEILESRRDFGRHYSHCNAAAISSVRHIACTLPRRGLQRLASGQTFHVK